jgi:acetyl-CoA acetyltransferase
MTARGQAAVVGIGETKVGKHPGSTVMQLQTEAARLAISDSGLDAREIDALFAKPMNEEPVFLYSIALADHMGLRPSYTLAVDAGGTACVTMLSMACAGIAAGLFNVALCVAGAPDATFRRRLQGVGMHRGGEEWEHPSGSFGAPPKFAEVAQRHMRRYGTTSEQLAEIAVSTRYHASLNDNAYKRDLIDVNDVLESRWIAEPLHMLDCAMPIDGAGAFIVARSDRARDLRHPPAFVLGLGGHVTHRFPSATPADQEFPVAESARQAFTMAQLRPADIDVAELYDCFTITTLVQLENVGFCEPGEGGAFVGDGRIRIGGALPVNTHGGLLSQGHVDGMLHILEGVRQIRGQAGAHQVPDCRVALVTGVGGTISSHGTVILGSSL